MYLPGGKGVRIDSAIYSGCEVSPYYDSMITKLIVFAATRKEAIAKMHRALGEVIIEGTQRILISFMRLWNVRIIRRAILRFSIWKRCLKNVVRKSKSKIHILFCIFEMYFLSIRLT